MKISRNYLIIILFSLFFVSSTFSQQYIPGQVYYGRNNYIEYSVPESCNVIISIYNPLGQKREILVDEFKVSGLHKTTWNSSSQPGGFYIYRIEANGFMLSKKMFLLK